MTAVHLRALSAQPRFRALLRIRLVGQVSDGLLQAGLVGVVLFAPERAASPGRVAAGFAVLLLPFCLIAPLAGVLLDRWSRVRVLAWANLLRALLLALTAVAASVGSADAAVFGCALVAIGLNRLVLAGLGSSLPRTLPNDLLVSGNALAPTLGTAATVVGAATGLMLRGWFSVGGAGAPFAAASAGYLGAMLTTRWFSTDDLGPEPEPDTTERGRRKPGVIAKAWSDVRSGGAAIVASAPASKALGVMGLNRILFGAFTVWTVLLIRFHLEITRSSEKQSLEALGAVALALGIGLVVAALTAPHLVRRGGARKAISLGLAAAACGAGVPLLSVELGSLLIAWVLIGGGAQILKITVDTVLQRAVDDELRGRVFVAYDIVFNVAFVGGVVLIALLPAQRLEGAAVAVAVALGYASLALTVLGARRT